MLFRKYKRCGIIISVTNKKIEELLTGAFGISKKLQRIGSEAENGLKDKLEEYKNIADYNQLKVLCAMRENRLSETHFAGTTGYGYNDTGREALERIYSDVFDCESALVRPQMISGTHAIATALFGNLRYGDELLSVTGRPYDTLLKVIGQTPAKGSLAEHGVTYKEAALTEDGKPDFDEIRRLITANTKIAAIQRSKGYAWRRSFTVEEINEIIRFVKSIRKDMICFVDNCYGEFCETEEPKADILAGSLIKNPGGGLAPVGGYIAGAEEYVYAAACRLNTPGAGREIGPTLGFTTPFLQGFFLAPQIVGGALGGAAFAAAVFEMLGYPVLPKPEEKRTDIVQAVQMKNSGEVLAFCRGIQKAAPVDSFVTPEPWEMPGYDCQVVMAAGAFVQGSSIELSADAPLREPYTVFFQGGLSYMHAKTGVLTGLNEMLKNGFLVI